MHVSRHYEVPSHFLLIDWVLPGLPFSTFVTHWFPYISPSASYQALHFQSDIFHALTVKLTLPGDARCIKEASHKETWQTQIRSLPKREIKRPFIKKTEALSTQSLELQFTHTTHNTTQHNTDSKRLTRKEVSGISGTSITKSISWLISFRALAWYSTDCLWEPLHGSSLR